MKDIKSIVSNYGTKHELSKFIGEPLNEDLAMGTTSATAPAAAAQSNADPKTMTVVQDTQLADNFIKGIVAKNPALVEKIKQAIVKLANMYLGGKPESERVGYYKISNQNMKLHFEPAQVGNESAYKAVFQFVENQSRHDDLAAEFERATIYYGGGEGEGTDADAVFAIPAALRAWCNKTGKYFYDEMPAVRKAFAKKTNGKNLYNVAANEIEEAKDSKNGATLLYAAFWVDSNGYENRQEAGVYYASKVLKNAHIEPKEAQKIADLVEHNAEQVDIQKFILSCSFDHIRQINSIFKNRQSDLYKLVSQNVSGDLKLAFKYVFMAAGVIPQDNVYIRIYNLIANGTGNKNFIEIG